VTCCFRHRKRSQGRRHVDRLATVPVLAAALLVHLSEMTAGFMMVSMHLQDCPVEAHLYKVLVYEPGGHFAVHRDTGEHGTFLL
jgi:hypothetical protein